MTMEESSRQVPWQAYYGPNLGYVQDQYEKYVADPGTVDPAYRELFDQWGEPPQSEYSAASMIDNKLQGPHKCFGAP
uniref:2-oxoglutarate dehydrogenase E1 component N-terminal domain-containing protein n=1 Tax=Paenibacillus polymyxa TaxID=1406 RepID=A0AAE9PQA8_PAEPO